jgi:hypothetical protein
MLKNKKLIIVILILLIVLITIVYNTIYSSKEIDFISKAPNKIICASRIFFRVKR